MRRIRHSPIVRAKFILGFISIATLCVSTSVATAQVTGANKECEELKQQISDLQNALKTATKTFERFRREYDATLDSTGKFDRWFGEHGSLDPKKQEQPAADDEIKKEYRENLKVFAKIAEDISKEESALQEQAKKIAALQARLADCGKKKPVNAPAPSDSVAASAIDPCLIGAWTATSVKDNKPAPMSGGTGFKIIFTPDGHESIDYSGMKTFTWSLGDGSFTYAGSATAAVEARDGFAKIDKMENAGVSGTMRVKSVGVNSSKRMPDLGIGIASIRGGINYTCNGETLTYQTFHKDKSDFNLTITLTKAKP